MPCDDITTVGLDAVEPEGERGEVKEARSEAIQFAAAISITHV